MRLRLEQSARDDLEGENLLGPLEPGEDHWHGAAPDRFMTHLAMLDVDDEGNAANWGDHVTDEEYDAAPESTAG
jgi:quercetin dioxygenase-like cupin family protein